jgi:hypothetical protein
MEATLQLIMEQLRELKSDITTVSSGQEELKTVSTEMITDFCEVSSELKIDINDISAELETDNEPTRRPRRPA